MPQFLSIRNTRFRRGPLVHIDEKACASVMRRYRLKTKREAINFALRALAAEPLSVESARKLRGTGWSGDLDAMRTDRAS